MTDAPRPDPSALCPCSCGDPCPLRKTGSESRCTARQVADAFGCDPAEAWSRLADWQRCGLAPSAPAREVEQARCPACAGTGLQHYIGCGPGGIDPPETSVEVCSDCSGSGRLSAPAREVDRLMAEWYAGMVPSSNPRVLTSHPAFRAIVAMGDAAVPAILGRLAKRPGVLVWALPEITGKNLVPEHSRGRIGEMCEAWVEWGKAKGLIADPSAPARDQLPDEFLGAAPRNFADVTATCRSFVAGYLAFLRLDEDKRGDVEKLIASVADPDVEDHERESVFATLAMVLFPKRCRRDDIPSAPAPRAGPAEAEAEAMDAEKLKERHRSSVVLLNALICRDVFGDAARYGYLLDTVNALLAAWRAAAAVLRRLERIDGYCPICEARVGHATDCVLAASLGPVPREGET